MFHILLSPPLAFLIMLFFIAGLARLVSLLAHRGAKKTAGQGKAYACGEDIADHLAQPDYSQFFPFAFFFTIVHVAALMVTTVPMETARALVMALMYIFAVVVGLYILLRR